MDSIKINFNEKKYEGASVYSFGPEVSVENCYDTVENLLEDNQYISHSQHDFGLKEVRFEIIVKRNDT